MMYLNSNSFFNKPVPRWLKRLTRSEERMNAYEEERLLQKVPALFSYFNLSLISIVKVLRYDDIWFLDRFRKNSN